MAEPKQKRQSSTSKEKKMKDLAYKSERISQSRTAGMMVGPEKSYTKRENYGANNPAADRYNSYISTSFGSNVLNDIPKHFRSINVNNGNIIQFPTTLEEKFEWYRYFARTDAYVGRGVELNTDLPLGKMALLMPDIDTDGLTKEKKVLIKEFFQAMIDNMRLFRKVYEMTYEKNVIGDAFVFIEWDEERKRWDKISILPPEEVTPFAIPFTDRRQFVYRPYGIIDIVVKGLSSFDAMSQEEKQIFLSVPEEIKIQIRDHKAILMDDDPRDGSFVYQMSAKRHAYLDRGASPLEKLIEPMLLKYMFQYTQLNVASRNMTPRNLVTVVNGSESDVDLIRAEVDYSMLDPDYSIVTNLELTWNQIGADNRILDFATEYERIDSRTFAALGLPPEMITGTSQYSGARVNLEIVSTMFLQSREEIREFVEEFLFKKVAEENKWYHENEMGIKIYWYPKVKFSRLSIRDNAEVFESLFSLYQKGSLPIDTLYEFLDLNPNELHAKIKEDSFTVKDSTFNAFLNQAMTDSGSAFAAGTNLIDIFVKYYESKGIVKNAVPEDSGAMPDGSEVMPEEI